MLGYLLSTGAMDKNRPVRSSAVRAQNTWANTGVGYSSDEDYDVGAEAT